MYDGAVELNQCRLLSNYRQEDMFDKESISIDQYDAAYGQRKAKCDRDVAAADEDDARLKETLPVSIAREDEAAKEIMSNIEATKKVLDELYALDVVFPKYRTLVALCSMYEYFMTGRVSQLKGPDGAYNLYESELRQNMIISQLDNISSKLDSIQTNQYTLYAELKKANEYLSTINDTMFSALETLEHIADSAELGNLISSNIAQNAEALKYIALIK